MRSTTPPQNPLHRRTSPRTSPGTITSPRAKPGSPSPVDRVKKVKKKGDDKKTPPKDKQVPPKVPPKTNSTPGETSVLKPPSSLTLKISPKNDTNFQSDKVSIKESPASPMSPFYKPFPPFVPKEDQDHDVNVTVNVDEEIRTKLPTNKSNCPCGASSLGKEWNLKCTRCSQMWHASCSNLKGFNKIQEKTPQQVAINLVLEHWLCPWCFAPSHPRPGSSTSSKLDSSLKANVDYSQNIQVISDAIGHAVNNSMPVVEIYSLEARLKQLSEEIFTFQKSRSPGHHVVGPDLEPPVALPTPIEPPVSNYQTDLLDKPCLTALSQFLDDCRTSDMFVKKSGRHILKYGESYTYTGDSSAPESSAIPPPLIQVIDKVVDKCKLTYRPNSVLINYYPPLNDIGEISSLPSHSDDEPDILADSEIATVSIGDKRSINFSLIHHLKKPPEFMKNICPESNSVYVMTRSSQAWYRHSISPTVNTAAQLPVEIGRFSVTLRTISKKFNRSTVVIGDSNTKPIKFGSGKGTVGESLPGTRVKASKISSIDPLSCIGYSNVVIVCGTNDLRIESVKKAGDIHQLVDILSFKLQQIKKLCPHTKIFVTAVLPSRLPAMNKNIMLFNNLVSEMLYQNFKDTVWHIGVEHFLDNKGLLSMNLTRDGDDIHLGTHGISKFVRCIKHWVYVRERCERTRQRKTNQSVGTYPT